MCLMQPTLAHTGILHTLRYAYVRIRACELIQMNANIGPFVISGL